MERTQFSVFSNISQIRHFKLQLCLVLYVVKKIKINNLNHISQNM